MYKLLEACSSVILLGFEKQTIEIIRALNKDYGIKPIVYSCERMCIIHPFVRFSSTIQLLKNNDYYTVHSILDIAEKNCTGNMILVPCTAQFAKLVEKDLDIFENVYIVANPCDILNSSPSYSKKIARTLRVTERKA